MIAVPQAAAVTVLTERAVFSSRKGAVETLDSAVSPLSSSSFILLGSCSKDGF